MEVGGGGEGPGEVIRIYLETGGEGEITVLIPRECNGRVTRIYVTDNVS